MTTEVLMKTPAVENLTVEQPSIDKSGENKPKVADTVAQPLVTLDTLLKAPQTTESRSNDPTVQES